MIYYNRSKRGQKKPYYPATKHLAFFAGNNDCPKPPILPKKSNSYLLPTQKWLQLLHLLVELFDSSVAQTSENQDNENAEYTSRKMDPRDFATGDLDRFRLDRPASSSKKRSDCDDKLNSGPSKERGNASSWIATGPLYMHTRKQNNASANGKYTTNCRAAVKIYRSSKTQHHNWLFEYSHMPEIPSKFVLMSTVKIKTYILHPKFLT